jgi:hypothetical protein
MSKYSVPRPRLSRSTYRYIKYEKSALKPIEAQSENDKDEHEEGSNFNAR